MSSKVFLSCRGSDARWAASTLHSELSHILGDGQVFMDVDAFDAGLAQSKTSKKGRTLYRLT
ncbi:MAG: hypothetical protein AAFO51_02440 [Pseudomonadota bacterium]